MWRFSNTNHENNLKTGVFLLVLFFLIFSCAPAVLAADEVKYGDIDANGSIDIVDVVAVMKHALNFEPLTVVRQELADVSGDAAVNVLDVNLIMQKALGLIDQFPLDLSGSGAQFIVEPHHNSVHGHGWIPETTITVTLDGIKFTEISNADGEFNMVGWEYPGLEIEAGMGVVVTDGETTKTHIVRNLAVSAVDADSDQVSGKAEAGSEVKVRVHEMGQEYIDMPLRVVETGALGNWNAGFTQDVGSDLSDRAYNIAENTTGDARISDLTGDATLVYWYVFNTAFEVYPADNLVRGFDWLINAELTVMVNDQEYEANTDSSGYFDLEVTVAGGDLVKVTDGVNTKQHTVTALEITFVDKTIGLVSGKADPQHLVFIQLLEPMVGQPGPPTVIKELEVTPAANGSWSANFSQSVGSNQVVYAAQVDADGDTTAAAVD